MPKFLTDTQIRQFHDAGYVAPFRAMSRDDALACRRRIEAYEQAAGHDANQTLKIKGHLAFPWLVELGRNNSVLDAVEDLIGPDILLFTSTLWPKSGGDGRYVSWHQDSAYFGFDRHDEVTAWVALTNSSAENGCVRVMPGSHRGPDYQHEETLAKDNLLIRGQTIQGLDEAKAVRLELHPGQFSLHHERMAHSSQPNLSSGRRIGYALFYIPTYVKSTLGRRTALLVRGKDAYGNWDPDPVSQRDDDPAIDAFIRNTFHQYRDQEASEA